MFLFKNAKLVFRNIFFPLLILNFNIGCVWDSPEENASYLPLNDSEYPYAGLPRFVIETESFMEIRDKETEHPAKMQIWGEKEPLSEIMDLVVKGRGNSSLKMTKYNMKLEFSKKESFFGMPTDKDWVLVGNHADKTLLRNYITLKIGQWLEMKYVPRCDFVEVYLNRDYKGVYLLMEKVKVSKRRVNISKDESEFLVEADHYYGSDEQIVRTNFTGLPFKIHYPKNASDSTLNLLKDHLDSWESFIQTDFDYGELISKWIDIQEYIKYYWIEEFAKNVDSNLKTSVYFTWRKNGLIEMGPIWDFDLSYGEYKLLEPEYWYSNLSPWNVYIFKNKDFRKNVTEFWKENRDVFVAARDSLDSYEKYIGAAAQNNFKRYPILESTLLWMHNQSFKSHRDAVEFLKKWMSQRIDWIDKHL